VSSSINPVVAGAQGSLLIQSFDAFNNRRSVGGSGFSLLMTLGSSSFSSTPQDNGDGTYTRTFNRTLAGTYAVQASYNGVPFSTAAAPQVVVPGEGLDLASLLLRRFQVLQEKPRSDSSLDEAVLPHSILVIHFLPLAPVFSEENEAPEMPSLPIYLTQFSTELLTSPSFLS
jgi:hypothetical protein